MRSISGYIKTVNLRLNDVNVKKCNCHSELDSESQSGMSLWFSAGFTLAEVLITLGIIGVVSAMTIPNLMFKIKESRTVNLVRQTQSILAQAMMRAEEEYGECEGWGLTHDAAGATLAASYLRDFITFGVDCGISDFDNICVGKVYRQKNGTIISQSYSTYPMRYKLMLRNGVALMIIPILAYDSNRSNKKTIQFDIDVNGNKSPNIIGEDLFIFEYGQGGLRAMGASDSLYPYESHCKDKNSSGFGCTFQLVQQRNMEYLK